MVLNARGDFSLFCVFLLEWPFTKKTQIEHTLAVRYCNRYSTPTTPKPTMRSPVVTFKEGMNMNKHTKTKIGVGSIVKAKVGELEKITREGKTRRTRKDVVVCVQRLVGKNKLLVLLEDGKKK